MIVGIDATALTVSSPGGIGTSQYETMRALAALGTPHTFLLYATRPPLVPFSTEPLDIGWPVRLGSGAAARSNIVWMQTGVNRLIAEDRVDVFWGPRHLLPFGARGVAKVGTIHDFWSRYYPDQQPLANRLATRALTSRVSRAADIIVTPSEATARDVEKFLGTPRDRLRVVPWGVDSAVFAPAPGAIIDAALERLGVARPYVVVMDSYNPRKNVSVVLDALGRLAVTGQAMDVVALGRPRASAVEIDLTALAAANAVGDALHLPGDVSRADLVALMSGALAFVYPSVYEGFGMPVLEAMACGCPVVTSDTSSLPEVAGSAGILVDPTDPAAIAAALRRLLADTGERARLSAAGMERAATFTWRRTAEGMLDALELAVSLRAERGAR